MKKKQLQNIFTKTILAGSGILCATSSFAAPCSYSFETKTVGSNIVCSATNSSEDPFSSVFSNIKFNGTVSIPANPIQVPGNGALILGGNVNFTKAVTITDVLSSASNAKSMHIQQGTTTIGAGITISNTNAPFTAGMQILGDSVATTTFNITSISSANNNGYGLWISNKLTSGTISGAVNISNTNHNYINSVATNVDQAYGIKLDGTAAPVFNGAVTISEVQITSGAQLGLGTGIDIRSGAYPKFNNSVGISITPTSTSNTKGIYANNSKADFAAVTTKNHGVHISADNSTLVFAGAVTISDSGVVGLPKTGIKAVSAANISLNSTLDITGPLTYGVDIAGASTVINFAKAVNITDNLTAINIATSGKGVFNGAVTINKANSALSNVQGINISSGSAQFAENVQISNMDLPAITIKQSSPNFSKATTISTSKQGILLDTSSSPTFTGNVTISRASNHPIIPDELSTYAIKIDNNSTPTFSSDISTANIKRAIALDNTSSVNFNGNIVMNDQRNFAFPSEGMFIDHGSTANINKNITATNLNGAGLTLLNKSTATVKGLFTGDGLADAAIYIGGGSKLTLAQQPVLNGNGVGVQIDGASSAIVLSTDLNITNSKLSGIKLTNGANHSFNNIKVSGNNLDQAIGLFNSTGIFNGTIVYSNGSGINSFVSNVTFNEIVTGTGGNSAQHMGVIADSGSKMTFNKAVILQNGYDVGIRAVADSNTIFNGAVNISSARGKGIYIDDTLYLYTGFQATPPHTANAVASFAQLVSFANNKYDIDIKNASVDFSKAVSSNNNITAGDFANYNSIKISGASSKVNFIDSVTINNSLTGISLDNKANPTFSKGISITQDLSGSGNTKLLPTDGMVFTSGAAGKFDGVINITNMTNTGLNIQSSSPVFNKTVLLTDNKIGAFISQGSDVNFVEGISGNYSSTSSSLNTIGLHVVGSKVTSNKAVNIRDHETNILADNSTILFTDVVSVSDSGLNLTPKTGIKFTNAANATFNSTVNVNLFPTGGVLSKGIDISGANTIPNFKGLVRVDNTLLGINIVNNSKGVFAGGVSINNINLAQSNLQGINISSAGADFPGGVSIGGMDLPAITIKQSSPSFAITNIASSKQGILVDDNSAPLFTSSVTISRQLNHPIIPDELKTYAMTVDNKSSITINGNVSTANVNKAIVLDNGSSASFGGNITMDDQRSFAFPSNGMILDNSSTAIMSQAVTATNLNGSGVTVSNNSSANIKGTFTASKITGTALYVGSGSKVVMEQAATFTSNSAAMQFDNTNTVNSFTEVINLTNNKYDIDINNTVVNFVNAITSNNTITSGNFVNYNSIKIGGANSTGTFSGPITISNSLSPISLNTKANPTFSTISITQDLSPSGNTKMLPIDGILFSSSSSGKFDGVVSISNMTNRALNINNSSPVFNNNLSLLDNKNGIFMDGASAPVFNKSINISKTDTIQIPVEIGVEITDSSTPIFANDLSVSKNKYGIGISNNSNATFGGVVNSSNNRGPYVGETVDFIGLYGIKIIDNSNGNFKGNVIVVDNYYKHIVDVNPSIGYAQVAKGIYIDDNSSASFTGSVTTSMLNYPQQLSEGIRISNNSSADFSGVVSTSSHYQSIIVDNVSKATFNDNVQMREERVLVPLNNSAGLTVDNASEVLFNSDITANGFWRAGIEIKNGSVANFQGVVTAKDNLSPVANTATTMDVGSTAINISDSTVTFTKQPVLDSNYNAIKISGATSDVTFSTDLLFTNNKSYGINLADISAINFKNITYNSDPTAYFSTFLNSKASKVTFDGTVECNSGLCLTIQDTSNIVFNKTFTANNTSISSPFLLNTTAIDSKQSTQLIFNKAVNIDGFYIGINSMEDKYLSFADTVNIVNDKGFAINLAQPQLAEFKKSVNIEGELNGSSSAYGMYIAGYFNTPDPHQVVFYGNVDIKNQFTGIYLESSNVEFQKVVNVESGINQSSGYGIYIPAQTNDSSLNKIVFTDDVTIKNQSIAGLYVEKNNTVFNGNVTIEDSYNSLFSSASFDLTTNPTPTFNKNVTINNGVNGIFAVGGELIFNGPVVINKSSSKGMDISSGSYNNENSKLYFNDTVEVKDCVVAISTYNSSASNYLTFEKGLTINNSNIVANQEVVMGFDDYITFNSDSPINAQIEGGIVTITGAPPISRTIQDAQIVDFTLSDSSKRISLNSDIGGTEIYTNAIKIGIDGNITFTGNLHSDNTIFDLSSKILTIDGSFTHGTNPVAKFASFALTPVGGITIDTYYDGTNAGHFEFATPSTVIDLSNSSKMIINITEATGLPVLKVGETRQFDLFVGNGVSNFQLIDVNNITITSNNPLSKWTIDTQEGILSQSLKTDGVGNMFKMVDSDGVTDPLMDSEDFVQELLDIIMNKGPIAGADALDKIGTPDAVIAASAPLSNIETGIIDTRLSSVIGAGDEEPIYGAWFAPLYGKATQKQREDQPGFKSTYFGGIIGFDSKIDDYLSVGIAAGMSDGKLNHTDSNKGDRTNHKAYVGIIYLSYDLTERWMLQNTFSYGFSRVHNKEIRISTPVNKIARAKYDERRLSNNIGLGYKTLLSNEMLLIPFFALDFNRVGSINYTETGADIQNLKFSRSSLMEVDGIMGARLSRNFQYEDFVITPAVVANMRYAISGKEFTTDVRLAADDTIQIVPKTVSPARKLYRLGASININNKDKDLLINYEFRKAEKFTSHQGSLKIQIAF